MKSISNPPSTSSNPPQPENRSKEEGASSPRRAQVSGSAPDLATKVDALAKAGPPLLVSSPIKDQAPPDAFHLYPASVRIKRAFHSGSSTPPDRTNSEINHFSDKSQGRLRFLATNSGAVLVSQFGLTYHKKWPSDGREFKKHLRTFLVAIKRKFPTFQNLWIAEFQSRGCPHVHLFSNLSAADRDAGRFLADTWARIVDQGNASLLAFHRHASNFIPWEMRRGSYLCKYLDKKAQKCIPPGFSNFGRFWGNSRDLLAPPEIIPLADLDASLGWEAIDYATGEQIDSCRPSVYLTRTLGRYHAKQSKRRSFFRQRSCTVSCLTGAPIARQVLAYLERLKPPEDRPPF
jgi:hypothetical protein